MGNRGGEGFSCWFSGIGVVCVCIYVLCFVDREGWWGVGDIRDVRDVRDVRDMGI